MLQAFLIWWWQRLLECLPAALRGQQDELADAFIIEPVADASPPAVALTGRRASREEPLGRFGLTAAGMATLRRMLDSRPGTPLLLRIPPDTMLERPVTLPLAAERDIGRVLAYDMDRITPFTADEVFWTHAISERDRTRGRLLARLLIVPKAPFLSLLEVLKQAGLAPVALEATAPLRRVKLSRAPSARDRWRRWGLAGGGAAVGALALAAILLPFLLQSAERRQVEAEIAALRPHVEAVDALRRDLAARAGSVDVVVAERTRVGDAVGVLAAITEILPDDTYLNSFALHQGRIEMTGQSDGAARLIAALSADPAIRNPAFAAPVTRIQTGRADLFSIRAEIAR